MIWNGTSTTLTPPSTVSLKLTTTFSRASSMWSTNFPSRLLCDGSRAIKTVTHHASNYLSLLLPIVLPMTFVPRRTVNILATLDASPTGSPVRKLLSSTMANWSPRPTTIMLPPWLLLPDYASTSSRILRNATNSSRTTGPTPLSMTSTGKQLILPWRQFPLDATSNYLNLLTNGLRPFTTLPRSTIALTAGASLANTFETLSRRISTTCSALPANDALLPILKHSWTSNNISLATIPPLQWLIVSCLPLNDGSKICRLTMSRNFQRMILIRIEYSTKPSMMPFPTRTLLDGVISSEATSQNTGNSVLRYTTKICNLATTTLWHCGCARPWMQSGK